LSKVMSRGFSPIVSFDRKRKRPIHEQIAEALRLAIIEGRIQAGTRLASTRVLATDWAASRNTVLQVFETLTAEGFLSAHVGDGTYVTDIGARMRQAPGTRVGIAETTTSEYPFRGLSRRGRQAIGSLTPFRFETPVPFAPNLADSREFPIRSWLRLMNEISGKLTGDALSVAPDAGYMPLRQAIAHRVSMTRGLRCDADQVIITSGSQQGYNLVVRMLSDRGDPVWVEDPGYPGTRAVLDAYGANTQIMPVDAAGACVEIAIEKNLAPRLIILSPARQFPTGATLSEARRRRLLEFVRRSGAWVVEDDFDAEFQYVAPLQESLAAQDLSNRVILLATFSTTLVPSLRMGYLVVPKDLIRPFSAVRSLTQGNAPLMEQMVLAEMMNRGIYAAHIRKMRKLYRTRQLSLLSLLQTHLGVSVPQHQLSTGMHVLLPLRDDCNDVQLSDLLGNAGVVSQPLSPLYVREHKKKGLLLGFAAFDESTMQKSASHLALLKPYLCT